MIINRRFSKQRKIIYDFVLNNPIHPSADTVYNMLKADYPELSLGTVYRNLNILADLGHVQRIISGVTSERFDARSDKHYHMICEKCNRMFDIDIPYKNNPISDAQAISLHTIKSYQLIFSGVCESCSK